MSKDKLHETALDFKMYFDPKESHMMRARLQGMYELWLLNLIKRRLDPKGVFIDGGVNRGYHSLFVAHHYPDSTIIGFEPDPDNCKWFKKSIKANKFKNITLIPKALHDTCGKTELYKGFKSGWNSMVFLETANFPETVPIMTTTLDTELSELDRISFIKLDIEGAEYQALQGAEGTLGKTDTIVMEYCQDERLEKFGYTLKHFTDLLERHNFTVSFQGAVRKGKGHIIGIKGD